MLLGFRNTSDDAALRSHLRQHYGVMISGGYGSIAGKVFRLGHMGITAHPTTVVAQIGLLERTLVDLGHGIALGAGVAAALVEFSQWDDSSHSYA